MQITLTPATPAEKRLLSAFINDWADLQQLEMEDYQKRFENMMPPQVAPIADEAEVVQSPEKPKRTRAKKEDPVVVPEENESAAGSSETAQDAVTHDTLKLLYGQMVQAGKRDEVVRAVKSFGYSVIRDIPADKLEEVHAAMKAVA